ncbi:hypothetical protein CTI14_67860, partial [Methylobacterium radiotolerans]
MLLSLAGFGAILRMIKGPALLDRVLGGRLLLVVVASADHRPGCLAVCSVLLSLAGFGAILRMIKGPAL